MKKAINKTIQKLSQQYDRDSTKYRKCAMPLILKCLKYNINVNCEKYVGGKKLICRKCGKWYHRLKEIYENVCKLCTNFVSNGNLYCEKHLCKTCLKQQNNLAKNYWIIAILEKRKRLCLPKPIWKIIIKMLNNYYIQADTVHQNLSHEHILLLNNNPKVYCPRIQLLIKSINN